MRFVNRVGHCGSEDKQEKANVRRHCGTVDNRGGLMLDVTVDCRQPRKG